METIIISGKSQSGKDTAANMMREELEKAGCRCITIHFADLVKFYAKQYYNWDGEKNKEGRALLQSIGTNKVRALLPEYWAEIVAKFLAISAHYNDFDVAFIPDARFENEIEIVMEYNPSSTVIRIERYDENGDMYINPDFTEEQKNHPSETSLDNYAGFDYIIENHNLDELKESIETVLADLNILR